MLHMGRKRTVFFIVIISTLLFSSLVVVSAFNFFEWLKNKLGYDKQEKFSPPLPDAKSGNTFVNEPNPNAYSSVGSTVWESPINAKFDDGIKAAIDLDDEDISDYLAARDFNFNIPSGAVINGISVKVKASKECGSALCQIRDYSVKLVKNGVISGNDKASISFWNYTSSYRIYGSGSDLWGLSWTPADINSPNFGMAISAFGYSRLRGGKNAYIDWIGIIVNYTIPQIICGNGIVESGEVCDGNVKACFVGDVLGRQTCNALCSGFNSCTTDINLSVQSQRPPAIPFNINEVYYHGLNVSNNLNLSLFAGKVLVLDLCDLTRCVPCLWMIDGLGNSSSWVPLYNKYKASGLDIIVAGGSNYDTIDSVRSYAHNHSLQFHAAFAGRNFPENQIYYDYNLYPSAGIPVTVIIDKKGNIRYWGRYFKKRSEMESIIAPLLAE